ncbi:MAG: hypothetical protein PF569_00400 [Candidatus Woesearchaeota archaeon]|jgi:hypothetical protein|nr:hypothetical protein [Candidatus Woesearchaeota archaeon]
MNKHAPQYAKKHPKHIRYGIYMLYALAMIFVIPMAVGYSIVMGHHFKIK